MLKHFLGLNVGRSFSLVFKDRKSKNKLSLLSCHILPDPSLEHFPRLAAGRGITAPPKPHMHSTLLFS